MILHWTRLNNKILDSNASRESSSLKMRQVHIAMNINFQDLIKNNVIVYSKTSPLRHYI